MPLDASSWLSCQEPREPLDWLRASGRVDERRPRLFACACVRRVWQPRAALPWHADRPRRLRGCRGRLKPLRGKYTRCDSLLAWHVPPSPGTGRFEHRPRKPSCSAGVALAGAFVVDCLAFREGPDERW